MGLGKQINKLIKGSNGAQMLITLLKMKMYEVAVNINMFGTFMKNIIIRNRYDTHCHFK
jgi:hypothetical protein